MSMGNRKTRRRAAALNRVDRKIARLAMASALAAMTAPAFAFEIDTGNPEIDIHWDTQLKYTAAFRVEGASADVLENSGQDDGDRNFGKGLISNRGDLFTEFDLKYHGWGFRVSGAGWYDTVYNKSNDNNSPGTVNYPAPTNEFPRATRELHGKKVELLDAFVFGRTKLMDRTLSFRAGRYALQWGETLILGSNGIAGGMSPVDLVKLASVPNALFKEIIRPVGQVSAQWSLSPDASLAVYYQYQWEANVFPGVGSYFSTADSFDAGGIYQVPPNGRTRKDDDKARDQGQFGAQLRFRIRDWSPDFGIYAIHYHSKSPSQVSLTAGSPFAPGAAYQAAYAEDITAVGVSANNTFGTLNVGMEGSMRFNAPLASQTNNTTLANFSNADRPGWAVGHTLHFNVNALWTVPRNFIAEESAFTAEIAYNHLQTVTENSSALAINSQRDGLAIALRYTPTYRQVLPGLDVSVPLGVTYAPMGNDAANVYGAAFGDDGGTASVGLSFSYLNVWSADLQYTRFFGPDGYQALGPVPLATLGEPTFDRTIADRDFVSISIRRTF